jgi:hypothetical protein
MVKSELSLFPITALSINLSILFRFFRFNSGIFLDSGILLAPGARGGLSR